MDDRDRQVKRMLEQGLPKVRIAARLGISRETVDRIAARLGYPARRRGPAKHPWVDIREMYEQGHSAAACMRHFNVSPSSWAAAVARGDIRPRPRGHEQRPPGERRREVERLLNEGIGIAEIAERLGISKPTVCYHARRLGVPPQEKFARRFDWVEIQRVYDTRVSMQECVKRFGFSSAAWADAVARGDIIPRSGIIPMEELLVKGRRTGRRHLKERLVRAGLKFNQCESCGIGEWLGKPLSMQLHHRNGDGYDNRLENLEFLCPNCHSQTDTYGGRNGHRKPSVGLIEDEEAA